ncbi:MAG: acyl carrier protein [Pseudomonadota bacterium]
MAPVQRASREKGKVLGTMEPQQIERKVKEIISEVLDLPAEQVVDTASLIDDLKADSLDRTHVVLKIEETFGLETPDEDTDQMKTVHDIVEYVKAHAK